MATQPKPWKPYWKLLDAVLESLVAIAPPSPIQGPVSEWIRGLRFEDSFCVDEALRFWLCSKNPGPNFNDYTTLNPSANVQWETILRFCCALDFIKGRWGKRKEFDFSRPPNEVLTDLLSTLWREDAFHWCSRCIFEGGDRPDGFLPSPSTFPELN